MSTKKVIASKSQPKRSAVSTGRTSQTEKQRKPRTKRATAARENVEHDRESLLQNILENLATDSGHGLNLSVTEIKTLTSLKFPNKDYILDFDNKGLLLEILGLLVNYPVTFVISFLSTAENPDYILWNQPSMDEYYANFEKEVSVYQMEEKGIVEAGKCRFCPSEELVMIRKQTRSGDEPITTFFKCVKCQKGWKV